MSAIDRDPIFAMRTLADLLVDEELLSWDLLVCQASDEPPSVKEGGEQFIQLQLDSVKSEIELRRRFASRPGAPEWPPEPTAELREFWRSLKVAIGIPDLWARYFPAFPLRKSGRNWRGPCPLHGGKNETSVSIYNSDRNWHCFTCGEQGDVFTLAGLVYQTTRFQEIADRLADEFGIEKPAADYSRNPNPLGERISGIVPKAKKTRAFQPFERRNGELVRL